MSRVVQQFDGDYNFMCIGCDKTIAHEDLYIEVRQRDFQDADTRLACHLRCLARLEAR